MREGFMLDHTYGANCQATWVDGAPEGTIWGGVKIRGRPQRAVTTYCCDACGYLESYAASS